MVDLLLATPEEQILRRDIYDRAPIFTWSKGLVTLLGDSAHAMQPNLGQGGCMAIEVPTIDVIPCITKSMLVNTSPSLLFGWPSWWPWMSVFVE